jgi:hypothetical protein
MGLLFGVHRSIIDSRESSVLSHAIQLADPVQQSSHHEFCVGCVAFSARYTDDRATLSVRNNVTS